MIIDSPKVNRLIGGTVKVVNGKLVRGSLGFSEENLLTIKRDCYEDVCLFDFSCSFVTKYQDLLKYCRIMYGLSSMDFICFNVLATGREQYITFSAFLFFSSLRRYIVDKCVARLVDIGFAELVEYTYKGRKCKKIGFTPKGRLAYEDVSNYWNMVLKYRTM